MLRRTSLRAARRPLHHLIRQGAFTSQSYFFLPAAGGGTRPLKVDTGSGFFGCFGFLVSLLPRS